MKYEAYPKKLSREKLTTNNTLNQYLLNCGFTANSYHLLISPIDEWDPYSLPGVKEVTTYLMEVIGEKFANIPKSITIISDYDADGCTSNAILKLTLEKLGFTVHYYVPHRINDGYGMSVKIVDKVHASYPEDKIIMTCDNGIVALDAIQHAKDMGYTVIITDHHIENETIDDIRKLAMVVHPNIEDENGNKYPFRDISGATVAYKLCTALLNASKIDDEDLREYLLQLATISIVSDVMPVATVDDMEHNENRKILMRGIESLRTKPNKRWLPLFKYLKINPEEIDETTIGFYIAPAINAVGRLNSASIAIDFLTSKNEDDCKLNASLMEFFNTHRKLMKAEALSKIKPDVTKQVVIVNEEIHEGLIGIIAGNLCEEYQKPAVVMTPCEVEGKKAWKGSARSIPSLQMYNLLTNIQNKEPVLYAFGGHAGAAGLTVLDENLEKFKTLMNEMAEKMLEGMTEGKVYYLNVDADDLVAYSKAQAALKPYGEGFAKPLLRFEVPVVNINLFYSSGHVKYSIKTKDGYLDIWDYFALDKVKKTPNFMKDFYKTRDNVEKRLETMSRTEAMEGRWECYSGKNNLFEFYAEVDYGSMMNSVTTIISPKCITRIK